MMIPFTSAVTTILSGIVETLLLIWCFWKTDAPNAKGARRWLAWFCLLPVLYLYVPFFAPLTKPGDTVMVFINVTVRYLIRLLGVFGFLLIGKQIERPVAFYFANLYTVQYQSYRMLMELTGLDSTVKDIFADLPNVFLSRGIYLFVKFTLVALFTLVFKKMVFEKPLVGATTPRNIMAAVSLVIIIVMRAGFMSYSDDMSTTRLAALLSLIPILTLVMMLEMERMLSMQAELEEDRTQRIVDGYRLRAADRKTEPEENLRTLSHDNKNHLVAIRNLAREGDSPSVVQYTEDLLKEYAERGTAVDTGRNFVNGLVGVKIDEANAKGIHTSVVMDARALSFVADIDLCTVLGNALDNAIEACEKVEDPEKRFLDIRGGSIANQQFIWISNAADGVPEFKNGLPVSTKEEASHGIGLKSLKKTVEKYGGSISFDAEDDRFTLTMLFPEK